jgi:cytidine deaminase
MKQQEIKVTLKTYEAESELSQEAINLLNKAKEASKLAYAPYSKFQVGATLSLSNNETVSGSNQENASYPVGICAERVALSNLAMQHPNTVVKSIAIYVNNDAKHAPAAPCGMCRQALYEQETRQQHPIKILLKGNRNDIVEIASVKDILPLGFSGGDLNE